MKKGKNRESQIFLEEFEKVCQQKNMSQNLLAQKIGYKGSANITNIRSGKSGVNHEVLKTFAKMFGYSISYFFEPPSDEAEMIVAESDAIYIRKYENEDLLEKIKFIEENNENFLRLFETGIELSKKNRVIHQEILEIIELLS